MKAAALSRLIRWLSIDGRASNTRHRGWITRTSAGGSTVQHRTSGWAVRTSAVRACSSISIASADIGDINLGRWGSDHPTRVRIGSRAVIVPEAWSRVMCPRGVCCGQSVQGDPRDYCVSSRAGRFGFEPGSVLRLTFFRSRRALAVDRSSGQYSSVAQWQSIRLLTGGLLVRVQPEEPTRCATWQPRAVSRSRGTSLRSARSASARALLQTPSVLTESSRDASIWVSTFLMGTCSSPTCGMAPSLFVGHLVGSAGCDNLRRRFFNNRREP